MVVRGTIINDDGENGTARKRKSSVGVLTNRREIPEKYCLMRYRIRAAMSDGMRMKVFSLLWSTYNTNNTGTSQYLGSQHGPLTYSKTAFPSDTTTLPLQAPRGLCATHVLSVFDDKTFVVEQRKET